MNQIKRKRRLSPLEAAVLGNTLYLVIVLIYKSVFDVVRTDAFNYLFNGIQLLTIGIFWIVLFMICFKNISGNEKPRTFKYIFFSLIPIVVLTASLTLVALLVPGQDTVNIWNQFAFLAAPTIFWYLPFGLIYQLVGSSISIFAFIGIALLFTVAFQVIGIVLGRLMGHKYLQETRIEDTAVAAKEVSAKKEPKKDKKKAKKKGKLPERSSIGIDGFSDEMINEGFTPDEGVNMTEVIINDEVSGRRNERKPLKSETGLFERIAAADQQPVRPNEEIVKSIEPAKMPEVVAEKSGEAEKAADDWKLSEPMTLDQAQEKLSKHQESTDKSFLKETSAIRIINEEDIEEYYRNKK